VSDARSDRRQRWCDALAGIVAAAVALATGQFVTAFDAEGTTLVTAVGDEFIDAFAGPLKDLAVELFGTNDKAALVTGIVVVSLAIGAVLGIAARRRPWVGVAGFVVFGVVGAASYLATPLGSDALGIAAAALAVVAGVASLQFLLRLAAPPAATAPVVVLDGVARDGDIEPVAAATAMTQPDRRLFLTAAGSLAVGAAGTAALGRRLGAADPSAEFRASTVLPEVSSGLPATSVPPAPFTEAGLSPYVTPVPDFFRIDTALVVPRIDPATWSMEVTGLVDRPFSITLDELLAMEAVEVPITLQCVSNEVGGPLVGNAVWQGVPLVELLDRAGVQPEGTQVLGRSVDGFTAGFPTELLDDGRPAILAYGMNGELLIPMHGFPARLVVSGLYGYVSATKWLQSIELTRFEDVDGYWVPLGWAKEAPVKTMSRIDVPRRTEAVLAGPVVCAGVAWSMPRGISRVEVRVDEGDWQTAELGDATSGHTWVQWRAVVDVEPGDHILTVRATDADGELQTDEPASPAPDGATGHHARRFEAS